MLEFRDIKGFEGSFQISNTGVVISMSRKVFIVRSGNIDHNRALKSITVTPRVAKMGYYMVQLWKGNKGYSKYIHRLVAETFIPNPDNKEQVNHKNLNKLDNNMENLEWMTGLENTRHAIKNGVSQKLWKSVRCVDTNKVYASLAQAESDAFGVKKGGQNISRAIKTNGTCKGLRWEYV